MSYLTMKGGVGKTTLAANVTRALADLEPRKILLIDADAQCNLSQVFCSAETIDRDSTRSIASMFDASHKLLDPNDLKQNVYNANGSLIDLIIGSFETFALAFATPTIQDRASQTFHKFMKIAQEQYDIIVLDTNPSATFSTLQALDVSNYLVAPITFDSFSMRGIDLICKTMRDRYPWLTNSRCVKIVPNKVVRASNESARLRQEEDENRIIHAFEHLEDSVSVSRIHESRFLDNRLSKRGTGFVIDQRVFPMHRGALRKVAEDFTNVARGINASLKEAFGNEVNEQKTTVDAVRDKLSGFLGGSLARH